VFYNGSIDLRTQAFWCIYDIIIGGNLENLCSFILNGSLFETFAIREMFETNDEELLTTLLRLMEFLLKVICFFSNKDNCLRLIVIIRVPGPDY